MPRTVPSTASRASRNAISLQGFCPSNRISTSTRVRKIANGSLVPDSTSIVAATRGRKPQAARMHQEEHRRGVGRGHRRAEQQALEPAQAEAVDRDRRREHGRDQHPDGRERAGRAEHAAEGGEAGAQAAIEQDQRQRDRADRVDQRHIVEADAAGPGLARQHSHQDEDQQQWCAKAQSHKARQDAGQRQQGARNMKRLIELSDAIANR